MKHKHSLARFVHLFANGQVHTYPCSSHKFHNILSILFLAVTLMVSGNVWGDNITYAGTETFYFDKVSNSGWGTVVANDANIYLQFANNGNNQTRSTAAIWHEDPYLKVTVPAGTYNQVRIIRVNKNNDGQVWNEFNWITLQTGKNRILNGGSLDYYEVAPCDNPKPSTNYYMAGQGFPNISWDRQSITMKWDCDKAVYYYTFSNLAADNSMTYRFKLNPSTVGDWSQQLNSNNIDNNYKDYANLTLKSDNEDNRITFDLAVKSNVTIYTKDGKVWASQEEAGDPLSSNDYYLRGDLWQNSGGNGWENSTSKTPKFTKNNSNTKATMWYVMPSGLSKVRFEFYEGSTVQNPSSFWGSATGLTGEGTKDNKKLFDCPSSPKLLSFSYTAANKLVLTATAPELKSGFKVKYRKSGDSDWTEVALDANGEATLSNLQNNSKYYLIITDGGTLHAINWYGGLYFDMTNSNVAFDNKIAYYSSVSTGSNYPISSIAEPNGVFNITGGNTDVKVKFDGGSIQLTKVAATKYTVTFNSKGGSDVASQEVTSGGFATKPTPDPTKDGYKFMGWSETDGGNVVDVTTIAITGNKTFYAKWEDYCSSYSFHYGTEGQSDWTIECFDGSSYSIADFVIPNKSNYWVGWGGHWQGTDPNNYSVLATFANNLVLSQSLKTNESAGTKVGSAVGAKGTLKVDNSWGCCNKRINFDPAGYGLCYGTEGQAGWQAVALTHTSGVEYMSGDVTLTADMVNGTTSYYVGILAPGSDLGYVYMGHSETTKVNTMGTFYNGTWGSNLNTFAAGDKGKLRMWSDDFDNKNWKAHFVPYWTLKYDLNGQSGTAPEGAEVFSEASQQDRTITITSTVPQATHKVFDGWYTEKTGGTKLNAGGEYILNAHATIYAHWTDAPQWTVTFDSDGGSAVDPQTVWNGETATEPSPAPTKTDLSFKEWQLNGVKYDFSTPVTAHITLKAIWSDVCDMADVKYAEPVVADMTKSNLFNEDDNTEPATLTKCQIKVGSQGNHVAYVDNNDTKVKHGEGSTDYYYWYKIEAGTASYATDGKIYYFKNVGNGKYLRVVDGNFGGGNWDWKDVITDTKTDANNDRCKWFYKSSSGNARLVNFASKKSDNNAYQTGEHFLHRYEVNSAPCNTYVVAGSSDGNQGNWQLTTSFINSSTVDNPNYLKATVEQSGKTYYRFANNAVVSTTLPKALKAEDKITVYYYATTATTAELRINGAKVATIDASAGVNTYVYTAVAGDAGQTAVAVASNSTSFLMAQIEVARPTPTSPRASNLAWDTDLSAGVTQMVDAGTFTHTATAKGAGAITYSSSNEAVATVAATGLVTPIAEGTTVIKATLEQDGCYEGKEITYNVTLTDLPKPTITFTTLPSEMPQGAVQQVVVTTTAGADFALAITAGTGATLTITEQTATQITANLAMGESATNIELTASTKRVDGVVAQHAVAQTVIVSQCIPDGSDIFSFTFSTSDAANAQPATGLVGGSVSQTALGTAGTTDNPKMVDVIRMKYQVDNQSPDRNFAVDLASNPYIKVQADGSGDAAYWYLIPTGATYKPSWTNNTYPLYYVYNKSTHKYLTHGETLNNSSSNDWKYYTTITTAAKDETDAYKWFFDSSKDGGTRIVNRADAGESLPHSFVLNTCNQHHNICDAVAPKPALICGHTSDANSHTIAFDLASLTSQEANPVMFKSVQYNSKTYYIISSEGKITINCAIKEGDKIRIDTYDRKTNTANIEEITAQSDMSSYEYTTSNEYLCVAGITIFRPKYGEYTTPTLSWDAVLTEPQLVDLNNGGTAATHVATSNVTTVATVMYSSSDNRISVNEQTGAVTIDANTPDHTTATITATLPAVGCYDVAYTSYTILVKNVQSGSLQERIDGTDPGATLTLDWDYANNDATISKKITINAQSHKIGNLTITTAGDLTLSSAMTANDFVIEANQVGHKSGQLKEAANLTLTGNAYMDLSFAAENAVTAGWYAFTVPFAVSSTNGVYNVEGTTATKLNNETQYAIMNYQGDVRAGGNYGWIKTHKVGGILQPGTLYVIAFGNTDYDKIRFVKASGTWGTNTVAIHQYTATEGKDAGWNGVGNPSLAYGNATNTGGATKAQFLDHENNAFVISDEAITAQTYIVSSAFFLQASESATMTFSAPVTPGTLKAPARVADANEEFMLELSQGAQFQDRIFLSASEEASDSYEIGHDLVKMGAVNGTAVVAQMAINGYNMSLCDAEFMLTNNQALFPLTLTAPKAGDYTLSVKRACEGQDLLVMNGSQVIWDLTQGDYTISLPQGATTTYSLLLQAGDHKMPTGNDAVKAAGEGVQKIILHNQLRILKDGKMFNAQGIQL